MRAGRKTDMGRRQTCPGSQSSDRAEMMMSTWHARSHSQDQENQVPMDTDRDGKKLLSQDEEAFLWHVRPGLMGNTGL